MIRRSFALSAEIFMTVETPYSVLTEVKLRWLGEFFTIGHFH